MGNNIGSKTIDAELIKRINQEWEFFEPIHKFMTRKTTNLHSYALTHRSDDDNSEHHTKVEEQILTSAVAQQELLLKTTKTPTKLSLNETITISKPKDCAKENIPNNTTIVVQSNVSQDNGIHLFSSDTNEEFQVVDDTTRILNKSKGRKLSVVGEDEDEGINCVRNTDHDFYSKRSLGDITAKEICCVRPIEDELQEEQLNYFADASEESQSSSNVVINISHLNNTPNCTTHLISKTTNNANLPSTEIKTENLNSFEELEIKEEMLSQEFLTDMPSTSTENNLSRNRTNPARFPKPRLSERDKYYRHKRRFNRRLEQRFDAILQVMGQVVKAGYPNVDITPLVGTVTSMAANMGKVLSSDSEDDSKNDEHV